MNHGRPAAGSAWSGKSSDVKRRAARSITPLVDVLERVPVGLEPRSLIEPLLQAHADVRLRLVLAVVVLDLDGEASMSPRRSLTRNVEPSRMLISSRATD
jgi:hypothetical protein